MITPALRRCAPVVLAAAWLASGCAQKVTSVSEDTTTPEGTVSPLTQLVVFGDYEIPVTYWSDFSPPGISVTDVLDATAAVRRGTPTTVYGMIFDGSAASGFQAFRREAGGGMRQLNDFVIPPSQRWLDSHWEFYSFRDDDPAREQPPTYQARGLLSGAATAHSPLSNVASATDTALADIGLRIIHGQPPIEPFTDSLFTVTWNAVPGAVGYYLHAFQFRNDLRDNLERTLAGAPAPFFEGKSKDIYAAYFPASVTQHKLGAGGGTLLTRRPTYYGQVYIVRVSAVDANGRMIAFSRLGDYRIGPYDAGYTLQPLGAVLVAPSRIAAIANRAVPSRLAADGAVRSGQILEADGVQYLHVER